GLSLECRSRQGRAEAHATLRRALRRQGGVRGVLTVERSETGDETHQSILAPLPCFLLARQSPPPEDCLEHVRQIVRWLRANERELRRRVAVGMVEYLAREYVREPGKDEDDAPEKIEPNIRIAEVEFIETWPARIDYAATGPLARMAWPWRAGVSVAVDRVDVVVRGHGVGAIRLHRV